MKRAIDVALDSLSRRAMTEYEIRKKLTLKGFPQDEIEEVLHQLKEWGYINDPYYAQMFCRGRLTRYSRRKIQNDLRLKGIEKELASRIVNEVYSSEEELAQCKIMAQKFWEQEEKQLRRKLNRKLSQGENGSSEENSNFGAKVGTEGLSDSLTEEMILIIKQKVGKKLMNKGYAWQSISAALEEIEKNRV